MFIEIDDYLNEKYNFQTEDIFNNTDYFTLKSKYSKSDIILIFRFLTKNDYINGVKYSEQNFLSIFFNPTIEVTIEFNSFTYLFVYVLENMSELFLDLTPTKIGKSERFRTKGSKNKASELLTAGNYSKAKNSYQNKK